MCSCFLKTSFHIPLAEPDIFIELRYDANFQAITLFRSWNAAFFMYSISQLFKISYCVCKMSKNSNTTNMTLIRILSGKCGCAFHCGSFVRFVILYRFDVCFLPLVLAFPSFTTSTNQTVNLANDIVRKCRKNIFVNYLLFLCVVFSLHFYFYFQLFRPFIVPY